MSKHGIYCYYIRMKAELANFSCYLYFFFFLLIAGALLFHILQPVYLSTLTVGFSPCDALQKSVKTNYLEKAIYDCMECLHIKLTKPFHLNKVCFVQLLMVFLTWRWLAHYMFCPSAIYYRGSYSGRQVTTVKRWWN